MPVGKIVAARLPLYQHLIVEQKCCKLWGQVCILCHERFNVALGVGMMDDLRGNDAKIGSSVDKQVCLTEGQEKMKGVFYDYFAPLFRRSDTLDGSVSVRDLLG